MRDLDLWLFSARLRTAILVTLGIGLWGGAGLATAVGPPDSFRSSRGLHRQADRCVDPGTLTDGRSGRESLIQSALPVTKAVRRDQTSRGSRDCARSRAVDIPPVLRDGSHSRRDPSVLVANAADITRLCRYLL